MIPFPKLTPSARLLPSWEKRFSNNLPSQASEGQSIRVFLDDLNQGNAGEKDLDSLQTLAESSGRAFQAQGGIKEVDDLSTYDLRSILSGEQNEVSQYREEAAQRAEQYKATSREEAGKARFKRGLALAGAGVAAMGMMALGVSRGLDTGLALGFSILGGGAAMSLHSAMSASHHQSKAELNNHFVGLAQDNESEYRLQENHLGSAIKHIQAWEKSQTA